MAQPPYALTAVDTDRLKPGITLVTCCKNRNDNLLRALPSWLAMPEITEIVIVDWSSDRRILADLKARGAIDPRIRVARVEDEPDWILSYAFNVGFRLAQHDRILKVDADIVLGPSFFDENTLEQGRFIAGNWRLADAGQQFVNGFFYVHTTDLMSVGGFNEYITTYGWDDDDLYDRMVASGIGRVDVAPGTIEHLDHDNTARLGSRSEDQRTGWTDLAEKTMFKIRTNRFIATIMPGWTVERQMMPYEVSEDYGTGLRMARNGTSIHLVPDHIAATARQLAAYELVSWQAGVRTFELSAEQLDLLLRCKRFDQITRLHIELLQAGAGPAALAAPRVLVADLQRGAVDADDHTLTTAAAKLDAMAMRQARTLVLRTFEAKRPARMPGALATAPYIPIPANLGSARIVRPEDIRHDSLTPVLILPLDAGALKNLPDTWGGTPLLSRPPAHLATPAVSTTKARLFIDAQHGLGNRLRAIGSAHAVAQATEREMVIVWEPDHHCEGHLSDLFDYAGPVETHSFMERAAAQGATTRTYLEIEPNADKTGPLLLEEGRDAYVRSAYVLTHPASTWEAECAFLRDLTPARDIRDLVARTGPAADIGLHIRMEGAPGTDTNSYDRIENWTPEGHAEINHWRTKSHYSHFIARLDQLLAEDPQARVFLAADMPDTYTAFAQTYGDRVASLPRSTYDRSADQLRYALADMLCLARCRHLLGSNWSSFTEGAQRLSATLKTIERAGVDF